MEEKKKIDAIKKLDIDKKEEEKKKQGYTSVVTGNIQKSKRDEKIKPSERPQLRKY